MFRTKPFTALIWLTCFFCVLVGSGFSSVANATSVAVPDAGFESNNFDGWSRGQQTGNLGNTITGNGTGVTVFSGTRTFTHSSHPSVGSPTKNDGTPNLYYAPAVAAGSWTFGPNNATYAAALQPKGEQTFSQAMTALGLSGSPQTAIQAQLTADRNASGFGSPTPTDAAWITKEVQLTANTTYTMSWNYLGTDYVPFNDGSVTSLVAVNVSSTPVIAVNNFERTYAMLGFTNPGTGDYSTNSYGATGWQTSTYEVSVTGTYKLGFAVFNLGDTALSPVLMIDNAAGTTSKCAQNGTNCVSFGGVAANNETAPTVAPTTTTTSTTSTTSTTTSTTSTTSTTVPTTTTTTTTTTSTTTTSTTTTSTTTTSTTTTSTSTTTIPQQQESQSGVIARFYNSGGGGSPQLPSENNFVNSTTYDNINQNFDSNPEFNLYDSFAVRYDGYLTTSVSGNIIFYTEADDGTKLFIDNELIDNNWFDKGCCGNNSNEVAFTAGTPKPFRLWFYENGGGAHVYLMWNIVNGVITSGDSLEFSIVPSSAFTQNAPTTPTTTTTTQPSTTTSTTTTEVSTTTTSSTTVPYQPAPSPNNPGQSDNGGGGGGDSSPTGTTVPPEPDTEPEQESTVTTLPEETLPETEETATTIPEESEPTATTLPLIEEDPTEPEVIETEPETVEVDNPLDNSTDLPEEFNELLDDASTEEIVEIITDVDFTKISDDQFEAVLDKVFEDISDTEKVTEVLTSLLSEELNKEQLVSVMEAVFSEDASVEQMNAVVDDLLKADLSGEELAAVFDAVFDKDLSDEETIELAQEVLKGELDAEEFGTVIDAIFDEVVTDEVLIKTFTAVLKTELDKEKFEAVVDVLESEVISKEQVAEVVTLIIQQEGGVDAEQATELATSPKVLESIDGSQATEVFAAVDVSEVSQETGSEIVEALAEAPTEVKEAFEEEINVFAGVFDEYVAIDSVINVGDRRTVIAVGAAAAVVGAAGVVGGTTSPGGNSPSNGPNNPSSQNDAARREDEEEPAGEIAGDGVEWIKKISIFKYNNGVKVLDWSQFMKKFSYGILNLGFTISGSLVVYLTLSGNIQRIAGISSIIALMGALYLHMKEPDSE